MHALLPSVGPLWEGGSGASEPDVLPNWPKTCTRIRRRCNSWMGRFTLYPASACFLGLTWRQWHAASLLGCIQRPEAWGVLTVRSAIFSVLSFVLHALVGVAISTFF